MMKMMKKSPASRDQSGPSPGNRNVVPYDNPELVQKLCFCTKTWRRHTKSPTTLKERRGLMRDEDLAKRKPAKPRPKGKPAKPRRWQL